MALEKSETDADTLARIANTDWTAITAETGLAAEVIIKQWAPNLNAEEVAVFTREPSVA